jgi:CubicO group peptidase (beta-lactamase class C family)
VTLDWDGAAELMDEIARGWARQEAPGGSIVLFDRESLRAESCGGFAHLELRTACTPDTVFRYASISKHFLSSLIVRDGRIRLQDRLGQHLQLPAALGDVSVGRALDMTGGIPDLMETCWQLGVAPSTRLGRDELLRFASSLEVLNFTSGSELSYSNTGYRLLQAAIEAKGCDYAELLRRRFFEPLGLGIVLPSDETEPVPHLATGYWRSPQGWRRGRYGPYFSASGGLAGSARDLASWAQALLCDRAPASGLLSVLGAPRQLADGRSTRYGLGLARYGVAGEVLFGHGGSLPGYKNHFLVSPRTGAGLVVLSNREDTDAQAIALAVMARLLGADAASAPAPDFAAGIFISEDEALWLELRAGEVNFLGARQSVFAASSGGVESRSAELPIRLHEDGEELSAEIGHVSRRFRRVTPGTPAGAGWAGHWRCRVQHGEFEIEVSRGTARLFCGTGPSRGSFDLAPISPDLALLERQDGPWHQHLCLKFEGDEIGLVTNRSRVLRFERRADRSRRDQGSCERG